MLTSLSTAASDDHDVIRSNSTSSYFSTPSGGSASSSATSRTESVADSSNLDSEYDDEPETEIQRAVIVTGVVTLAIAIEFGNALTLLAVATHCRLRRTKYIPVASLAVADFLMGSSAVLFLYNRFVVETSGGDTHTARLVLMTFIIVSADTSSWHLVVIAVDRCSLV